MALESMRRAYARDEVRELMEARDKAEHDAASRLKFAKDEGRSEGRSEGRTEGRSEGRLEVARNMLRQGMELELIAKVTGLTVEQLTEL